MSPENIAREITLRLLQFSIICIGLLALLIFRIWQLQLEQGEEYTSEIRNQSIRTIRIPPVRGVIKTSDGVEIVGNQAEYSLVFHPQEMRQSTISSLNRKSKYVFELAHKLAGKVNKSLNLNFKNIRNLCKADKNLDVFEVSNEEMNILTKRRFPKDFLIFSKKEKGKILLQISPKESQTADNYMRYINKISKIIGKPLQISELRIYQSLNKNQKLNLLVISEVDKRNLLYEDFPFKVITFKKQSLNTHLLTILTSEIHLKKQNSRKRTAQFIFDKVQEVTQVLNRINMLELSEIERHIKVYPALPFKGIRNLSMSEMSLIAELMPGVPGTEFLTSFKRKYKVNGFAPHILGFVGRKDPGKEENREEYSYFLPEIEGRDGIEKIYDKFMRGEGGAKLVQVDISGYIHKTFQTRDKKNGGNIKLTIDSKAQNIASKLLRGKKGAIVLMNCISGEILALASSPSYNLKEIHKNYGELASDKENRPLVNRALSAGYMPGSIIKPLIALAGLEYSNANENDINNCPGYYKYKDLKIRCHNKWGHGNINLSKAIEVSCNPYFINLGLKSGVKNILKIFDSVGIGRKPGINLPQEGSGISPAKYVKKNRWNAGETAFISMGQGKVSVSPLQVAVYISAIANGGNVLKPFVVSEIRDEKNTILKSFQKNIITQLNVSEKNIKIVQNSMRQVVVGSNASAKIAANALIPLAGKTGTAEIRSAAGGGKNTWFVCFGPFKNPRYTLVVLVENGKSGGKTCAPIAVSFFNSWLSVK